MSAGVGRFWRLGLRARLMTIGVTGVALALLAGGFGLYAALTLATNRTLDSETLATAQEVAALVDQDRLPTPVPASGTQLVQVVDAQQRVVGGSVSADRLVPVLNPAQLSTALTGQAVEVNGTRLGGSGPLRVRAVRAGPADAPVAVVVAVQIGEVLAVRSALRTALLVAFPVVLAVMAAVAWRVIGWTLRPVEQLRVGAERIGAGQRRTSPHEGEPAPPEERLPVPVAADEVRALALTLNGMLDRLAASRARQRTFVADAAHELRSPLTSMRTQLEVAQYLGEGGELPQDLLVDVARLSALVEDLLLLARTDADAPGPANPEVQDVREVMRDVAAQPVRAGVEIDVVAGPPVLVRADRSELRRVLVNLVTNAVRHAHSTVRLDAEPGDPVRLTVTDDGPGIPAADRERVFERFARRDDARSRDAGGSGLGLPIVAELVARAGGSVALEEAPGGGLRVVVALPAVAAIVTS